MKKRMKQLTALTLTTALILTAVSGCGSSDRNESTASGSSASGGQYFNPDTSVKDVLTRAASDGKIGNWGLGDQYEVLALLAKYNLSTSLLNQGFDMDGFDDDTIELASAMTYNELGLVENSYDGAYNYGSDGIGVIDFNKEGVAMLEDNLICKKEFAEKNPNTVKAFIYASMKGWEYAVNHLDEAAQIVYNNGSSVSMDHQDYMAKEMAKLVTTDTNGDSVTEYGNMNDDAMQQTLDIAKEYITLDDTSANEKLKNMTLDDVRDTSYWTDAMQQKFDTPEKKDVSIQLKWLPQSQFMGYFVAKDKGYYDEVGLNVDIVSGGGDISETTAVYNGTVDFGSSWLAPTISANAGGMDLLEVAQVSQSSGMVLIYKCNK